MLFRQTTLPGLADGSITLAFRWWRRPTVRAGGTLTTAVGVLSIDEVVVVAPGDVTDAEARRAGYRSASELLDDLPAREGSQLHRVALHLAGPDPRIALRADDDLDDAARAELQARLDRLDRASRRGPWTATVLDLIAEHPGVRAGDLAATLGRDTPSFKVDVRKLKALGLTESLEVGYRLSPRGEALRRG